jgi:membrane-bound lytic murein transglycosylase F
MNKNRMITWRLFGAFLMLLLVDLWPSEAFDDYKEVTRFDEYFSDYSEKYFGDDFDWRYFKAQAIAESRLDQNARSDEGARGIMQVLPQTFQYVKQKNPDITGTIEDPRCNIAAGIYYDKMLWDFWGAKRPFKDRLYFMFGAYNAGKGDILKAQKLAMEKGLNPVLWRSIEEVLYEVNGEESIETISYVSEIQEIKDALSIVASNDTI